MPEIKETSLVSSEIIQALIRAQKTFKMYPPNNPIYGKAVDEVFRLLTDRIGTNGQINLRLTAHEIHLDEDQVYKNESRQDNYALFFYRDGIRQLTFKSGLLREEVEQFLLITSKDLERQVIDDDMVTMLWEKDFEHIEYLASSEFLVEEDYDPNLEKPLERPPAPSEEALQQAYEEVTADSDKLQWQPRDIAGLTDQDLRIIERMKEKEDTSSPLPSVVNVLFDLFLRSRDATEISEIGGFLGEALEFSLRSAEFDDALRILEQASEMATSDGLPASHLETIRKVPDAAAKVDTVKEMGAVLDSGVSVNEEALLSCAAHLPVGAITPLTDILGTLQGMHGRRVVMDLLAVVGQKDLTTLAAGLRDKRWFVVRNTLCILGKIGDVKSVDTLGRCVPHEDPRVRKETFRSLGVIGGSRVLPHLKKGLSDRDSGVRISAVKAFRGLQDSEVAMRIVLEEVKQKDFGSKPFEEKKEFFAVISQWDNRDVKDFLVKTLEQKSFFGRAKIDEIRACAAHAIGLLKDGADLVPELQKAASSAGDLLRTEIRESLKKLKAHG